MFNNNRFEPVHVDGYLPYDGKLNSIYAWSEQFLWVGVLLKAAAKLFRGYDKVEKLTFDDWTRIILGFTMQTM